MIFLKKLHGVIINPDFCKYLSVHFIGMVEINLLVEDYLGFFGYITNTQHNSSLIDLVFVPSDLSCPLCVLLPACLLF